MEQALDHALFTLRRWRELDVPLFNIGTTPVSLFSITQLAVLLVLLVILSRWVSGLVSDRLLGQSSLELATRRTIGAIARYTLLTVGVVALMQTYGINLSTFNFLAGAFAVGVGFGLQNIFQNFISGLIIMFERPVKIGDRIELGAVQGDVVDIGARRTTVLTNDRIAVLIPNSRFITENVTNYAYLDAPIRIRLPVAIAAGADPREVERVLLAAAAHHEVLRDPPPAVRMLALQGGGAMAFELQVWNTTRVCDKDVLVSELYYAIHRALAEREIRLA